MCARQEEVHKRKAKQREGKGEMQRYRAGKCRMSLVFWFVGFEFGARILAFNWRATGGVCVVTCVVVCAYMHYQACGVET